MQHMQHLQHLQHTHTPHIQYMQHMQQIGDEIVEVNGQSLVNVPHREAIKMLKSSQSLMLTIRNRDVSGTTVVTMEITMATIIIQGVLVRIRTYIRL